MDTETEATRAILDVVPKYLDARARPMTEQQSQMLENFMKSIDALDDAGVYPLVISTCKLFTDYMEAM